MQLFPEVLTAPSSQPHGSTQEDGTLLPGTAQLAEGCPRWVLIPTMLTTELPQVCLSPPHTHAGERAMPTAGGAILTVTGLRSGPARRAQGALRGEPPSQRAADKHSGTAGRASGSGYRRRGACGRQCATLRGQRAVSTSDSLWGFPARSTPIFP